MAAKTDGLVSQAKEKAKALKRLQAIADLVNGQAEDTVRSIINTGEHLLEAKEEVGHGGWEKLFDRAALERPVRFHVRTARRYMAIAEKHIDLIVASEEAGSDGLSVFPPHVATLEALAALPRDVLRAAVKDGRIYPEMTTQDVGRLYVGSGTELPVQFTRWRGAAALARLGDTPRLVSQAVLNASSTKPTTVIVNSSAKEWSAKAASERLLAAVQAEYGEHGACREDRPELSKILRRLADDNDLGTRDLALRDKYVDGGAAWYSPEAHRVTATIAAEALAVEDRIPLAEAGAPAALPEH